MTTKKLLHLLPSLAIAFWLLAGCASPTAAPAAVPTTAPAAVPTASPAPVQPGTIAGSAHLMAPPSPPMVVYAVDKANGTWASVETKASDSGEGSFSLSVPPGSYQVFAAVVGGSAVNLGYSTDGLTLATVTVAAGQTVTDINVGPPSQSDCGSMMGYPASPDGRFAATAGPSADCLATSQASGSGSAASQTSPDTGRIQFQANATSWQTPGDLAPNASIRFVLSALKGQILTVELTTDPDPGPGPSASINIVGKDGQVLTPDLTTKWTGVLLASQDYTIEVHSLSQQAINYSLMVAIPAIGSTPYVPVTLEICQTIQAAAAEALGVPFVLAASAPFTDPVTGETGKGCRLTAQGNGSQFADPGGVIAKLVGALGFSEQPAYQAGGPTGAATGATRDMALALISAQWAPSPDVKCPADQPISACNLTPEQKLYTITIQVAMK